jgi:hypothetical protein
MTRILDVLHVHVNFLCNFDRDCFPGLHHLQNFFVKFLYVVESTG